jgi:DNA-binding transcriptional MerR regulator
MGERTGGRYSVKELAMRAGVTPRTIHYYVGEGLLPPPEGGGPASAYGEDHLLRLQLIRRLKDEYLPLAEIRRRLAGLGRDELRALLDAPPAGPPPDSARAYLARLLGARTGAAHGPTERPAPVPRADPRWGPRLAPDLAPPAGAPPPAKATPAPSPADPLGDPAPSARPSYAPLPTSAPQAPPLQHAPARDAPPAPWAETERGPPRGEAGPPAEQTWRRVRVTPDVELHVRVDGAPKARRRLDRMVEALRRVLEP